MSEISLRDTFAAIKTLANLPGVPMGTKLGINDLITDAEPTITHLSMKESITFQAPFQPTTGMRLPNTPYVITAPLTKTLLSTLFHCEKEIWPPPNRRVRPAVAKFVMLAGLNEEQARAMLRHVRKEVEAIMHRINNPHIIEGYDSGEIVGPDGKPLGGFLIYEDMDCDLLSLAAMIGYKFPLRLGRRFAWQACDGCAYAHDPNVNLIHRDIKPANILIAFGAGKREGDANVGDVAGSHAGGGTVENAHCKVADFGAVKMTDADMLDAMATQHAIPGTLGYMPPEQIHGEFSTAGDVYSLGATLYHAFSGKMPFDTPAGSPTTRELFHLLQKGEMPQPLKSRPEAAYLPKDFIAIIDEAMMLKNPKDRQTMRECGHRFEDLVLPRDPEAAFMNTLLFHDSNILAGADDLNSNPEM